MKDSNNDQTLHKTFPIILKVKFIIERKFKMSVEKNDFTA